MKSPVFGYYFLVTNFWVPKLWSSILGQHFWVDSFPVSMLVDVMGAEKGRGQNWVQNTYIYYIRVYKE